METLLSSETPSREVSVKSSKLPFAAASMDPALFSPASLFSHEDSDSDGDSRKEVKDALEFVERCHQFPGMVLSIREFTFHEVNANLLWPGTFSFAEWLVVHQNVLKGRQILELGSGTGALSIFLCKAFSMAITTSDFDDDVIEENIAYNCTVNGITKLAHIPHTWGNPLPTNLPKWDLILASDILLYVKQYPSLIKTLVALLEHGAKETKVSLCGEHQHTFTVDDEAKDFTLPSPCFLMSWRRRLPKEDELAFFEGCKESGLQVEHLGSRIYSIFRTS